ncbi:MAG: glycosyltransferase family 4 protein [Candidatus Zixiibacteriota bacterium]
MKIAIVHDWFVTYGGAERVVSEMLKLFPSADLFALYDFLPERDRIHIMNKKVTTSFLQKMPFAKKKYRSYLALMPLAIEQFDLSQYDLIISSSTAVAKGVITGPYQLHIAYVNSPIRYAWDLSQQYLNEAGLNRGFKGMIAKIILHYIRLWDIRSSFGVDYFIGNSKFIAGRIGKVYHRQAHFIYPPVDIESFVLETEKDDYYLTVSRMVPYKKIDMMVEAFTEMPDKKLIVIGDGPDYKKIKQKAGDNITLTGFLSSGEIVQYMKKARAFVFAAEEDFGIVPVEAQACGTPVIAYGRGGTLETVIANKTGIFFGEQTKESLKKAIIEFESIVHLFDPTELRKNALRFSPQRFNGEFISFINKVIEEFNGKHDLPDSRKLTIKGKAEIAESVDMETLKKIVD